MARDPEDGSKLDALAARIAAAREARSPKRKSAREDYSAGSLAWRMVTELVAGVLAGGLMGWGLDVLFGTFPIFLIVMGLFGFAAGIRMMMRSAEEVRGLEKYGGSDDPSGS